MVRSRSTTNMARMDRWNADPRTESIDVPAGSPAASPAESDSAPAPSDTAASMSPLPATDTECSQMVTLCTHFAGGLNARKDGLVGITDQDGLESKPAPSSPSC